jgi:hypothetical protein
MAALDVIGNEEYDEFDDQQLEATEAVGSPGTAPEAEAAADEPEKQVEGQANEQGKEEQSEEPGKYIPRHRYNFQRDQRLAAERQAQALQEELRKYQAYVQQMQQQQPQQERVDYDAKISEIDQQIEDARADGDTSKVSQLRAQQRKLEREAVMEQMYASMPRQQQQQLDPRQVIQQTSESLRLEQLIGQLEQQYPVLDETSDQFDAEMSDEIMNLYDSLRQRMPLSAAMERAVSYVTKAHDISPATQTKAPARKSVERNIRAAAAQPPELDGVGMDSAKAGVTRSVDIAKMTQDQFEQLSDSEIEKLLAAA